jgi:ketosteroid isomerase-like protein
VSAENVEAVRQGFAAFNEREVERLVGLSTPDCEWHPFRAQLEGIVYRGHEGVRRFVRDMDEDWQAFRIDPVEFHDRGDQVVVIGQVTAVGRGGVEIDSTGGFVFDVQAGRIAGLVSYSDPAAALEAKRTERRSP